MEVTNNVTAMAQDLSGRHQCCGLLEQATATILYEWFSRLLAVPSRPTVKMRLLETGPYAPGDIKFELVDSPGMTPPYAIISHTWSEPSHDEIDADIQA